MVTRRSGTDLPVEDRIGHFVKRAEQALMARKSQALRTVDLTVPQYNALLVLADNPGLSGAQLARRCFVTPQTMAALLANLEAKGLVTRRVSTVHAQVMQTALTRHGGSLLRKADRLAVSIETHLADAFSDTDRRSLMEMLERATRILETPNLSTE
ncbi:MAG: winged helix-turn-helix transcriptional regulator [Pseudonocardia sp.]|nr:winged helix-turn-helix transcriptional regulator [Pseudonocardia sp.]